MTPTVTLSLSEFDQMRRTQTDLQQQVLRLINAISAIHGDVDQFLEQFDESEARKNRAEYERLPP